MRPADPPSLWRVERRSGRRLERRQTIHTGQESEARAIYEQTRAALRHGEVRLLAPDGSLAARAWGSRSGRTRY